MSIQLSVVTLWAQDVKQTAHFYKDIIGLELVPHHGPGPTFRLGNTHLVILEGSPGPEQAHRFPYVAFGAGDLDQAIDRLKSHQVELPWGIENSIESRWIMLHDPAGNLIELAEFKHRD
jgi:catechol-2,3-dioxygenase